MSNAVMNVLMKDLNKSVLGIDTALDAFVKLPGGTG